MYIAWENWDPEEEIPYPDKGVWLIITEANDIELDAGDEESNKDASDEPANHRYEN